MFEEEPLGYEVFNVALRSNCRNATVVFSTEADKYLRLDQSPGRIVIKNPVDADVPLENGQRLERLFGAIGCHGDANRKMQCFVITVKDINDNTPVIKDEVYTASVTEVAISYSSKVLAVSPAIEIQDPDQSDVSYGLLEDNIPFKLVPLVYDPDDPVTCKPDKDFKIIVTDPAAIDYETTTSYSLTMMAWEGCGSSGDRTRNDTAILTISVIDADDEFPSFHSAEYTATVLETDLNKPLDVTPRILASDGDKGLNEAMVYGLLNPDQSRPDCLSNLQINNDTGDIRIVRKFSYDSDEGPCRLLVVASQADNPNRKTQSPLIITILDGNDKCPEFEKQSYDGNFTAGDSIVTEIDSGNALTVKLLDRDSTFVGDIAISPNNDWEIIKLTTSGSNTELKLASADGVTIVKNATFTLSVRDDSLENCHNTVTVSVHYIEDPDQSLLPQFTKKIYTATIPENSPVETPITQVTDMDGTSSGDYIFSLSDNTKLKISDSGIVTVDGELDAETMSATLTVTVSVEERYDPLKKSTGVLSLNIIDLNDNAPIIAEDVSLSISENDDTPLVFQLLANDKDVTSPNNEIIKYEILSAPLGTSIDELTQTVTISELVDREEKSVITLLILAKDGGYPQLEGLANITIDVIDVNEPPVFVDACDEVNVDENTVTTICIIQADDYDDTYNEVFYGLENNYNGLFSIDRESGHLSINSPGLNRENDGEFTLTVHATDNGSPELSSIKSIHVTVNDLNDNNPIFDSRRYIYNVNEDFKGRCNLQFGIAMVGNCPGKTDLRKFPRGSSPRGIIRTGTVGEKLSVHSRGSGNFTVVPETGEIRKTSCIDAEIDEVSYTFTLGAYNDLSPSSENGTTEVIINIHDMNDEPPILEVTNEDTNIEKDFVAPGEFLFNVTWSDSDVTEENRAVSIHCSFHPTFVSDLLECRITESTIIVKVKEGAVTTLDFRAVITIVVQNDEAPLFITYEELQLTVTSTHVPLNFDDQVVYIVEGDSNGNFYNPIVPDNNCLLYDVETHSDIFAIIPGKSISKLVSAFTLDYETNNTFHVHTTAYKGVEVDGNCKSIGVNDTAVLTVFVVDENDEPPQFEILDINNTFFEGVLFDTLLETVTIFSLSDRVLDRDRSAKLEFSLVATFSELSPLLCQSNGRVYMNPNFKQTMEGQKTFNYDVEVIDTNTDQNSNSSSCTLQFGILGWNNIAIFKSHNVEAVDHTIEKRQAIIGRRDDLIEKCLVKGKIGWWDSSGQILIKIDRIIKERNSVYIWLYGIGTRNNTFMEKKDLQRSVPPPEEILKQECGFEEVQQTDERAFVTYPLQQYAIVVIAALLLAGILGMMACLIYSWNHAERGSDYTDSRSLPESEQIPRDPNNAVPNRTIQQCQGTKESNRTNRPRETGLEMSDLASEEGSGVDTLRILPNKEDATKSFAKSRRHSGHYTKMGASALLCTGRNGSSKRSSPVVFLTKNQSIRSCVSGKEVLLNGEESTTDVQARQHDSEAETGLYQYPRGFGSKNPPLEEDEPMKFIGATLENPAYQASDEADEMGSIVVDEIYDTIDESNQTQF
ncbi:Protocadherin-like wing polarity protein stan [Holothuria leucospilota]|uniref:Protocadherin-like wing polarity protein stan n=1 Tax=Holothuria leucospilota TaxID=206669 RepID=A0A9Q0YM71_HOLLE|nr:Protocadherin-like wing polarity protein stan [Holothuria leucospilota]